MKTILLNIIMKEFNFKQKKHLKILFF